MLRRLFVASCAALAVANSALSEGPTLVYSENFDQVGAVAKGPWAQKKWSGDATFSVSEQGHGGGRCVEVTAPGGGEGAWYTTIPVTSKAVYRLSGWIKTENVVATTGHGAEFSIQNLKGANTPPLKGTGDWTEVSTLFDVGDLKEIRVNCLLGGWGTVSGKAAFDDVRIERLSQADLNPAITLHGDQVGAPISKYIYGQFIEHLGRCIYGGIWSEMLEDRKFFFDVGAKESPWKIVGGDVLKMVKESAFVGEHSPVVALAADAPHGISQGGLGILKDKEYVGYAWLAGSGTAEVALVWGKAENERAVVTLDGLQADYKNFPFKFTAGSDKNSASLELTAKGAGELKIGTLSLMPGDNVDGMRADTLAVLKELNAPVYRWPGGNFVSGYDWHDGLGDRDKRPPRKNPAWQGVEHNDFGADEYMRFLKELNADAYVVVNSGLGGVESAVEEVQYFVGSAETPGGKRRVDNGHADPYAVQFIGVGNEMYGDWQLGHMPLEEYVKKHNTFAEAIRKEAPNAQIVGVGDSGPWSETMLRQAGDHMNLLSEHFYNQDREEVIAHVQQIPNSIRAKAATHRSYFEKFPELKDKHIPICMDEWNYWYGPHRYGELGTQYFLKDALGIAEGLNAFYRASDTVFMANYAQTVNVIGCVKTSKVAACLDTTGVILALYRKQFGSLPIAVEGNTGPIDVTAAWTEAKDAVTVSLVNPTSETYDVALTPEALGTITGGKRWVVTGGAPLAKNVPGAQPGVTAMEEGLGTEVKSLPAPPLSATIYRLNVQR